MGHEWAGAPRIKKGQAAMRPSLHFDVLVAASGYRRTSDGRLVADTKQPVP